MSLLEFEYALTLDFSAPVKKHSFVLRCLPLEGAGERSDVRVEIAPYSRVWRSVEPSGCFVRGRVDFAHERFTVRAFGRTLAGESVDETEPHPMYTAFTPSTAPSERMKEIAADYLGRERKEKLAADMTERVHSLLKFSPDATKVGTSAATALEMGQGVCQDYAHVFCGIMRLLGVPTRYVAGLGRAEGETHAWNECYIDGRWLAFDPTLGERAEKNYVKFAAGVDAEHCALNRGVFEPIGVGSVEQKQSVFARVVTLV